MKLVVIAGPNGAGKSTVAPRLLRETLGVDEFVNADTIASGMSAFRPETAAVAADRVMLLRLRELAAQRVDFAFEGDAGRHARRSASARPDGEPDRRMARWESRLDSTGEDRTPRRPLRGRRRPKNR